MAAEEYRQLFDYLDDTGQEWRVSKEREEEFRRAHPEAKKFVRHFTPDGQEWRVGVDKVDAFRREHADAEPAYPIEQGGEIRNVRRSELPETIDRAAGPSDAGRSPLAEGARAAGRVLAALPAGAVNKVKESYAALTAGDEARRERAKAERAAPERIPTLKEAAKQIGLKPEEIEKLPDRLVTLKDLDDPRFGQAYRDSVRATMNRVAANAPETAEEKKHLEKAEKAQERYERLAKPVMEAENGVERALQTVGHGAGTVAEFAAANALAPGVGGNALMFAEGAANAAAAAEAQGKSASDAMALGIPAGLAEAAVWAAPTPGVAPGRLRVGSNGFGRLMRDVHVPAALRGAAGEAVVAGAKTDLSGVARRAVTGEEAPELRERVLEDLGGAAFGAVMGAVRGAQEARAERAGSAARTRLRQERRDAMQDLIAEQTQLREDNLAGRNGMEARVAERARVDAVYGYDPATPGERLPVESLEGAGRVAGYSGPRIRDTGRGEPEIVGPLGTEGARRPWADKIGPRLPETEEGVIAARRAALAALPPKERMARTSHETYFREHEGQSPVLETIGVKRFLELRRKFKNDFRDITGEKDFKPEEVAAELGRDPKDATAQSLLEEAAEEYARYERWRNELGAPDAELEAATGREAEWNRQQNDRAVDEAKRRWEETHPEEAGEPPLTERDLAGREAAAEEDFVERMERGVEDTPPPSAEPAPVAGSATPPRQAEPVTVDDLAGIYGLDAGRVAAIKQAGMTPVDFASGKWQMADDYAAKLEASGSPDAPQARAHANEMLRLFQEVQRRAAPPEPAPAAPEPPRRAAASPQQQLPGAPKTHRAVEHAVEKAAEWAEQQRQKAELEEAGISPEKDAKDRAKLKGDPEKEPDAEVRAKLDDLYAKCLEKRVALFHTTRDAAAQIGGRCMMRSEMKKRERAYFKTVRENGGRVDDLKDVIGGTVILAPADVEPDFNGLHVGTRAVEQCLPPGAKILRVKDFQSDCGYRDSKANVEYENGARGEVIVISDYMQRAKDEGHAAYEIDRMLPEDSGNLAIAELKADCLELQKALYNRALMESPEADSVIEALRAKASSSLKNLLGDEKNFTASSLDKSKLLELSPGLNEIKRPDVSSRSTTRPNPSENINGISAPPSSRGATTAPTSENLPQRAPEVNPTRAGAQAAPAQAAPGLAAPAAPEGGSRRPGVGGGVVTPPPPGSVQARLEGMLAVDGADAPLTPERSGEYRALADEAGRSGNYATRARALQRLGEFEGLPADHPEAARSLAEHEAGKPLLQLMQLPDLVEIARTLGHGSDPKVKRVLSPGWAAGLFRPEGGRGGVPIIEVLGKLHQVVPQTERQRLAGEAHLEAVRRLGPDAKAKAVKALEAEIYGRKFEDAWNDALARGPGQAMNVLAHEIGHWIDYLPDHIQKRGNILGHLAALDKWAKGWIAAEPGQKGKHADVIAAGDAAEAKVLRQPAEPLERFMDRRAKARSAAEEKAALARGFLMKRDVERELSDLVAWYRCSDGLPDYFKDPGELFAEAFSAYCNAPATTRAKAPKFAAALDGWLAERPEAQRAVFEGRARAEKLAAQALRTGKAAPDLDFFGRLREKIVAGTLAREKAQLARKEAQRQPMRDVCDLALATFVGRMEPIFRRARAAGGWKEDLADRVMGSILRFEHAGTAHEAEILRVRSELLPIVEGLEGGQGALDEFLMLRRIASETLGKERERGRVNLANPSGVTPGSAREVEWGRSAQARLQWIRENQPEQWEKLNRAADVLVDIRRGRDHSVLAELRDSGLIREDAMKEIWNNTDYAAFRRQLGMGDALPPVNGKRAAGDMSTWSGVYKQVTGSYGDIESPLLATLVGDATILRLARLNAARRDTAALLRRFFPGEVREVDESRWHANSHGEKIPEQSKDARWRTLVWKENGETRALEVPRLVADALADERKDWGAGRWAVDALNAAGRAWSMAMTGMNYAFAAKNVFRDKAAIARAMPGRDWGDGAGAWLSNVVGDYFTAAKTFASGHGQARRLGRANAELLQGLEEGVVAPGTMGGYMASLRGEDLAALYGPDTPARQRAIRGILEKSGLAPCVEKERTVVGKLAGKLWKLYASGIEKLADQETNNKVQAMLEIRRQHPEWSENRVAFHVARYIGTPDPTDAPNITKVPGFNLLVPFWTMTAHGNFDQIYRLGVEQKGASLARYGTHFAAKALMNFSGKAVAAWGAAQLVRAAAADDGTDEGRAEAADLRAQSAMAEDFASMQEAIPVHDRFTGTCIPLAWADKAAHKVWYLRIPSDQTIVPVDAATMGGFAINAKQADWHDILDGSLSTTMPSLGPGPTAFYGLATGQDLGRGGRSIDPEDGGNVMAARLEYFLKTAGVNAAGLWTKAPWAAAEVGEDVDALERFLRIPGFNATFGSFLRCSNGGRKAMAREYNKEVKAERLRNAGDADAYLAGDEAALVRLRERGADVGELIERAQKRRIKLETIRDPLERAGVQSGRARWNREKGNW